MELDTGNYNTLNKKYLQELYNYQRKQPYISANSLEYGSLAAEMALSQPTGVQSAQTTNQAIAKAQYIDESPSLMVGTEDKTLYYFDPSSGTLSEMPINKNQTPVSVQDLKTILASQKINQGDIQAAIDALKPTIPITTTATTEDEKNILTTFLKKAPYSNSIGDNKNMLFPDTFFLYKGSLFSFGIAVSAIYFA
jgi:hypothetical protein